MFPLSGLKVTSFAWLGAGPVGIRYLSTMGATVVRIESHRRIDNLRSMLPYKDGVVGVDRTPFFPDVNAAAMSVSIDLNKQSGLDIAWRLIEWADVIAENFTPGTMKKWGIDYFSVSKVKPDIIYLSSCQMGQSGPLAKYAGLGYHSAAMAGFSDLTGWSDREPAPIPTAFTDPLSARFVAIGILAALEYRRRTGHGQYIDISQLEVSIQHLAPAIMNCLVNGRSMTRCGNSLQYAAPHNVYPCKGNDRWCAVAVLNDTQWEAFCRVVDQEWVRETKFSTLLLRKKNEKELDELVSKWTIGRTAEEVEAHMQAEGVPSHVVSTMKDAFEDSQMRHRGFLRELKHSVMGYHTYHAHGFKLSKTDGTWRAGPALGEHNEYVFKELLGMTDDEIADALIEGGITTDADLPSYTQE